MGLLLVACTTGGAGENDGAIPIDGPPTADRSDASVPSELALALLTDGVRADDGRWTPSEAELRPGGEALFAFERPDVEPGCVRAATLEATITTPGDPVLAWVSLEGGLVDMAPGAALGNGVVAHGSPWIRPDVDDDVMRWDVAELVRWSLTEQAGDGALVLALKPEAMPRGGPAVGLGANEGGHPAVVTLAEEPGCEPP